MGSPPARCRAESATSMPAESCAETAACADRAPTEGGACATPGHRHPTTGRPHTVGRWIQADWCSPAPFAEQAGKGLFPDASWEGGDRGGASKTAAVARMSRRRRDVRAPVHRGDSRFGSAAPGLAADRGCFRGCLMASRMQAIGAMVTVERIRGRRVNVEVGEVPGIGLGSDRHRDRRTRPRKGDAIRGPRRRSGRSPASADAGN